MSAQFYGIIEIPAWLIDEVVDVEIQKEFRFNSKGEIVKEGGDTDYSCDNGVVTLSNYLASYGKFDDLESMLAEKEIPYDRYSSRDCEDDAERVYFRPEYGAGKDLITVSLKGYNEDSCVPVQQLRALMNKSFSEVLDEFQKILDEYDPQFTPLQQYALPDYEPNRSHEKRTALTKEQACQLLRSSGYSKVSVIGQDAGFFYLNAQKVYSSGALRHYDFRIHRYDTHVVHEYQLYCKPENVVEWYYSDSLGLEGIPQETEELLFSVGIVDGESREHYAVIGEDLDQASTLALKRHMELHGETDNQEGLPVIDPDTSYEITCASNGNGELFDVRLTPSEYRYQNL